MCWAVEIPKALFDATVRLCPLCRGSANRISQQVLIRGMFVSEVILEDLSLWIAHFSPLDTGL